MEMNGDNAVNHHWILQKIPRNVQNAMGHLRSLKEIGWIALLVVGILSGNDAWRNTKGRIVMTISEARHSDGAVAMDMCQ